MTAAIALPDPLAGIGNALLTSLLGAVVWAPMRLLLSPTINPIVRGRGDDVLTLLEVESPEQLDAFLLSRRGRWNTEILPLAATAYVSTKFGRKSDPEKALAEMKRAYDQAMDLVRRSEAPAETLATVRIALFSAARSLATIVRKDFDESRFPLNKLSPWKVLTGFQEPTMVVAALLFGLHSPDIVRGRSSLQVLADRLLKDADMLAQLVGDAQTSESPAPRLLDDARA